MNVLKEVYENIIYFLKLSITPEVLWNIVPLFFATILIILYFERYKQERPGWNSYLSNSLVLLFVSIALIRYIYTLDIFGFANFLHFYDKSLATLALIFIGSTLLRFNFGHILPEKIAMHASSTIFIHLLSYAAILFVHSNKPVSWFDLISLIIIVLVLSAFLNILKIPVRKSFQYIEKQKEKERVQNIKEAKFQVGELKEELKYREKELKNVELKKIEKQKKEAIKLKKILKK